MTAIMGHDRLEPRGRLGPGGGPGRPQLTLGVEELTDKDPTLFFPGRASKLLLTCGLQALGSRAKFSSSSRII